MSSSRRVSIVLCTVLLVSALVLAACQETASQVVLERAVRSWGGGPPDGSEVPDGEVRFLCIGFAPGGVSQIELYVNGVFANRAANPDPSNEYFPAWLTFETAGPGSYVVHCRTYDQAAAMVQSDPVTLRVTGEEPVATPGEEEIPTATPTSTEVPPTATVPPPTATGTSVPPTATRIPPTATRIPPTSTPRPPTATPQPPIISYLRANGTAGSITVPSGSKVTLSFEWQRVSAGYLDPGNIPMACPAMPCTYQVTPAATTTYTLRAVGPGGQTTAQVTVVVQGDTTGPSVQRVAASPDPMKWPSGCIPSETTVQAYVTDESGVNAVKVVYRVVRGTAGSWQSKSMHGQGGLYSTTINASDLELSMKEPAGAEQNGTLEFYVQAFDGAGNSTTSATDTVTIVHCFIIY